MSMRTLPKCIMRWKPLQPIPLLSRLQPHTPLHSLMQLFLLFHKDCIILYCCVGFHNDTSLKNCFMLLKRARWLQVQQNNNRTLLLPGYSQALCNHPPLPAVSFLSLQSQSDLSLHSSLWLLQGAAVWRVIQAWVLWTGGQGGGQGGLLRHWWMDLPLRGQEETWLKLRLTKTKGQKDTGV